MQKNWISYHNKGKGQVGWRMDDKNRKWEGGGTR